MRTFVGMILGCLMTIGIVYVHDVSATSTMASGTQTIEHCQIVNWDVASARWHDMKNNVRQTWTKLTANVG